MPGSRQAASPSLPASVPAATNTGPRRGVPESPWADQSNLHLFGGGGGGGLRATATESYMGGPCAWLLTPNFRHHNHICGLSWFIHDDYHGVVLLLLHGQSGVFTEKEEQTGRVADRVASCVIVNLIPPVWRIDTEGGCKCKCKCVRVRCAAVCG
ncbi:hypothetical protein CGCA056_v009889 [Colletotrichum aenigma]|uniref:uncharacterized protein n=1 Tax=Colletotrichum aenigma TaxID=1215731 RepID=UPI0018724BB9|nr:uncharacterized protein CGCA056_v009889 [Colletotrichum aenigma]KAF5519333.1 hypothetical protein CGCA056_v009889 [Colletotrichum aenigma]